MSIKDGIIAELKHETNNTKRVLNNLSDEHWTWKPHEKSMSLGALATHIVELHSWVTDAAGKDVFNFHIDYKPMPEMTLAAISSLLDSSLQKNIDFVNSKDDEFWLQEWTLKAGDHVISQLPRLGAVRYIITNHLIHHRGQLTVYMRLLDIPLPGIYGPTADDKN